MPGQQDWDAEGDPATDSVYIHVSAKPISYSIELTGDMILDIANDNTVVGIDIQHVSELVKEHSARKQMGDAQAHTPVSLQLVAR